MEGINNRFFSFMDYKTIPERETILKEINSSRKIVVANLLKDKLKVEKGEVVILKTPRGDIPYEVTGFFDSLEDMGQYALVGDRYLKLDMNQKYYSIVYIKTNEDPEVVQQQINKKYSREPFWNETKKNIAARNRKSNEQLFLLMDGFSYMTLLIGIFGVFNNYVISLLERQRSFAILRSIGMSKKQALKMLLIEALATGLIASIIGILTAIMNISIVVYLLKSMGLNGEILYKPEVFIFIFITGITVAMVSSISPALKSSNLSIIDSLK